MVEVVETVVVEAEMVDSEVETIAILAVVDTEEAAVAETIVVVETEEVTKSFCCQNASDENSIMYF
jgi:hypothetical protein